MTDSTDRKSVHHQIQFMIRLIILSITGLSALNSYCQPARTVTLYVSPKGQSGNPGTMDQPFSRPEEAWNAVSATKGPVNATIYIRAGHYFFKNSFALTQNDNDSTRHVSFSANPNEKVQFTGSAKLDNRSFTITNNQQVLSRLPAAARGKVYEIDLRQAGVTDFGKKVPHGYKTIRNAPLELFYNDSAMNVARYPNQGYMPIGQVLDHGSIPRKGEKPDRGGKFVFADPHMKNWQMANNAWVAGYFSYGYSDDYLPVDNFDIAAKTIQLKAPSLYGIFSTDDVSDGALKNSQKMRGFYVYNLLEELDSPGEWFLDEPSGKLYFWPPDNSMANADIEVSMLEEPIVTLNGTRNITFQGIQFTGSRGMGLVLKNTSNTRILHCDLGNLGTYGISAADQRGTTNKNILLSDCDIYNTGAGGVIMEGGDRKDLSPGNNILDNCEIYNYSRINKTFCPAVSLNGVANKITHCDIHDAPDQAILFYGNDHVIGYNHIKKVVTHMTDAGAVGTGRDIGSTGNQIINNFFEDIQSDVGASVCAIYLDDGSSGMEVGGNIFYRSGTPGSYGFGAVHIHGGTDNEFKNNQFIECKKAFSYSPLSDKEFDDVVNNQDLAKTYRAGVDLRSPAYAKYKHLARLTTPGAAPTRVNTIKNTVIYKVDALSDGGKGLEEKNTVSLNSDNDFDDPKNKNFKLRNVPSALQNDPDWKPVPVSEIGKHK
jgi:hypothetical protein